MQFHASCNYVYKLGYHFDDWITRFKPDLDRFWLSEVIGDYERTSVRFSLHTCPDCGKRTYRSVSDKKDLYQSEDRTGGQGKFGTRVKK